MLISIYYQDVQLSGFSLLYSNYVLITLLQSTKTNNNSFKILNQNHNKYSLFGYEKSLQLHYRNVINVNIDMELYFLFFSAYISFT